MALTAYPAAGHDRRVLVRELHRFLLLALAAMVIASGLATTSPVCCVVASLGSDECCASETERDASIEVGSCCDDEVPSPAATHTAPLAQLPARPTLLVTFAPSALREHAYLGPAPSAVRAVSSPPEGIPRIRATSRLLI